MTPVIARAAGCGRHRSSFLAVSGSLFVGVSASSGGRVPPRGSARRSKPLGKLDSAGVSSPRPRVLEVEGRESAARPPEIAADWLAELYEAAADATRWPRALGAVAGRVGARRAGVEVVDLANGALRFAAATAPRQQVRAASESLVAERSAPAAEWPPLALCFDGRAAVCRFPLRGTALVARLTLARGSASRPWNEADRGGIAMVASHLERALRLSLRSGAGAALPPPAVELALPPTSPQELLREVETSLRGVYGLTPAETRVATAFVCGSSIVQVAQQQGICVETVRSHLKRIYQKLGTTRQAELVHLVLTKSRVSPPPAPRTE